MPTVEDKLVQRSVAEILKRIWEQDFLRISYGYRPNKSAHQAVHSLGLNLQFKGYGYIVEADIKGFFDNMDHKWLMKMLKVRIDDSRLLNLINQWLKARIVEPDGKIRKPQSGTPQVVYFIFEYGVQCWPISTCTTCLISGLRKRSNPS